MALDATETDRPPRARIGRARSTLIAFFAAPAGYLPSSGLTKLGIFSRTFSAKGRACEAM
jgi:hypothetical protein